MREHFAHTHKPWSWMLLVDYYALIMSTSESAESSWIEPTVDPIVEAEPAEDPRGRVIYKT